MNFYLYDQEQTQGPFSKEQILELYSQGKLPGTLPCCAEGSAAWSTVAEIAGAAPSAARVADGGKAPAWSRHESYLLRRKVLVLLGASFHIYGPNQELLCFSKQKAFKLREDIRIYSDESMSTEILSIKARQIMDFSAAYDVIDSTTGQKLGALRRKGFSSLLRDTWHLLDAQDREIGAIQEDSMALALIRRFVMNLIPQAFHLTVNGKTAAQFQQMFNPFIYKLQIRFVPESELDHRLGLAAAILLAAIEGRQK